MPALMQMEMENTHGGLSISRIFCAQITFKSDIQPKRNRKFGLATPRRLSAKWVWYFVERIRALKDAKIVWPLDHQWYTHFGLTVDGIHCHLIP